MGHPSRVSHRAEEPNESSLRSAHPAAQNQKSALINGVWKKYGTRRCF
jgi:hypothetical protein